MATVKVSSVAEWINIDGEKKRLSFLLKKKKKKATCLRLVRTFVKPVAMTICTVQIIYIEKNFRSASFYKWTKINV